MENGNLPPPDLSADKAATLAYYDGLREGIMRFAWWKDGIQYVGCGVKTLKRALVDLDDEKRRRLG